MLNIFKLLTIVLCTCFISLNVKGSDTANYYIASTTGTCSYKIFHFKSTSTPGYTSLKWYLGNGSVITTTADTISALYTSAGSYPVRLTAFYPTDSATFITNIVVPHNVDINFTASDTAICPGTTVTFSNASSSVIPGGISYAWLINGDTSTALSPHYTFIDTSGGYYDIKLTATNSNGCSDVVVKHNYIHVFHIPNANFSVSRAVICRLPFDVTLTSTSAGATPFTYVWKFIEEGTTVTTTTNPVSHTYAPLRLTNTVKLVLIDAHGCKDSLNKTVKGDTIKARFTIDTSACIFTPVVFHNNSVFPTTPDSSVWIFGDGIRHVKSTSDTMQHIYNSAGPGSVTLIAKDGNCADTASQTFTVYPQPDANFSISPSIACHTYDTISFSPDTSYAQVLWKVNSGTVSLDTLRRALNYGISTITMYVKDFHGCRDTVSVQDTVYDMLAAIIAGTPMTAFSYPGDDEYTGCNHTVSFDAVVYTSIPNAFLYYVPYPSPPVYYSWDFGDGTFDAGATLSTLTHYYASTTPYTASCTMTMANGCVVTKSANVKVNVAPYIHYTAVPTHVCRNQPVEFEAHVDSGSVDNLIWNFGDGSPAESGWGGYHVFTHSGVFHPILSGFSGSCSRSYILPAPILVDSPYSHVTTVYNCAVPTEVAFGAGITGVDSLLWDFGDGTISGLDSPVHIFPSLGTYSVFLATYNSTSGCRDTALVYVNPRVIHPVFSVSDSAFCPGAMNIDSFVSAHDDAEFIYHQYNWYVNSVLKKTTYEALYDYVHPYSNFVDTFSAAGTYTVSLVGFDNHGCTDTTTHNVYVSKPSVGFVTQLKVCASDTISLIDTSTSISTRTLSNFHWYFNLTNGPSTSLTAITHVYTTTNFYDSVLVKDIVTDNIGCRDSAQKKVFVYKPVANFKPFTKFPCIGVPDSFTNNSSSKNPVRYLWSFGDGGPTSTVKNPKHTFTTGGTYSVTLTITDTVLGCVDDTIIIIKATGVTAAIAMDDSVSICTPLTVHFSGMGTNSDTGIIRYTWHINDLLVNGRFPSETYISAGIDTIVLIDSNLYGCKDTAYAHVRIFGKVGDFFVSQHIDCSPLSVTLGMQPPSGASLNWYIDGVLSGIIDTLAYTFTTPGTYYISLLLSDSATGCSSASPDTIRVDTLMASIGASSINVCLGLADTFYNNSTTLFSVPNHTHWDFGDGDTSVSYTAVHTYGAAGTYTVTLYSRDTLGCSSSTSLVVTVFPEVHISFIGHTMPVCGGSSVTLYDSLAGGTSPFTYLWSGPSLFSSILQNPSVTPVGPSIIGTYTLVATDAHGCKATADTTISFIDPDPNPGTITGSDSVCVGTSIILLTDGATGGTWTSSDNSVATVSATGSVGGAGIGTAVISYSVTNSCGTATVLHTIIVHTLPVAASIYGPSAVCVGMNISDTASVTGGTWTMTNNNALVGSTSGIVTGFSAGTDTVIYSLINTCGITTTTAVITVNPLPTITPSPAEVCIGSSIVLTGTPYGYMWSSTYDSVATIDITGIVLGISVGTNIITYANPYTGCFIADTVTVFPLPAVDSIIGASVVCSGDTLLLTNTTTGGVWSTSDTSIATISLDGTAIAVAEGNVTISYTITSTNGCAGIATHSLHVNPLPIIPSITGLAKECVGGGTNLYNDTIGGIWTSSDTAIATIDIWGTVAGISEGICTITYTYSSVYGCTSFVTTADTVINPPVALPNLGQDTVCIGDTSQLSNPAPGGFWLSADPSIASIDSFGLVTGISAGQTFVGYIIPTVCGYIISIDTIWVLGIHPEIHGPHAVCSGSTLHLTEIFGSGTWISSNPSVAMVDTLTGVVTGISFGSAIITCTGSNVCSSFTDTFRVLVDPSPFITTNFIVACQSLTDGESESGVPVIVTDPDGCLMVCENTTVRYYGNGVDSGHFTWACSGGTIVAMYGDNNDSIDVQWSTPGSGSISMTDTFSHCIGSASICIKVVSKPHAAASASSGAVCLGNQIAFFDHSTADTLSPITSWFWDFGDGTSSPLQNPIHNYSSPGTYYINLIVRNGCGCADTFKNIKIFVADSTGPVIYCPSIVCEREHATYSINDSTTCGPVWTVTGGTIISGDGTSSIEVEWDMPPADGFGYVSVEDACGSCSAPSIVKIPIILKAADISGPSNVCIKQPYVYSLPLWAATDYEWGVLGSPGIIIGHNNDHQITVKFPTPGYYTIHGWYNNQLKLCGGDVTKVVYVRDQADIAGPVSACFDNTASYSYSMSGWLSATWVVTDPLGSTSTYGPSTTFALTTPVPGVYTINASGDFCTNPITMTSIDLSPAIDSVRGPDTVCLNRVYTYTAYNDIPGTIYSWGAVGGHVIPASGSSVVDVIWTSSGTKQLMVKHDPDSDPHCPAPVTVLNITQENVSPVISGDDLPCANSHRQYSSGYYRADNYDWKIYPDSVGSVVAGNHSADVTVLWNNVVAPTNALLIVKVQKCDTSVSDTFHVTVQPPPIVYITTSDTAVCAGVPITFTPHNGTGNYRWDFGDGVTVISSAPVSHLFPANTSAGNVVYSVRLTSLFDTLDYCPSTGVAFTTIAMKPSPVAFASTADDWEWCTNDTVHLIGTVTDHVGTGLTFRWYRNGIAITGATLPDYAAVNPGYTTNNSFHFTVVSANGCSDTSADLMFVDVCHGAYDTSALPPHYPPPPPCCGGPSTSACGATVSGTVSCNVITLTSTGPSTSHWHAFNQPSIASASTWDINGNCAGPNASATYDIPGIYRFAYVYISPTGCRDTLVILDTVGIVPDFQYFLRCAPGGYDSVFFVDHSVHLSWFVPSSIAWTPASVTGTGAGTAIGVFATGSTPTVTETVSGTLGPFSCTVTKTLTIPARHPHFGFTFTPNNVCAGIPISFTPGSTAGIVSYLWDFGNGGTNRRQNPDCTYAWQSGSNPNQNIAILTVTDTLGCQFDTFVHFVNIYQNQLFGQMDIDTVICPNMVPFAINYIDGPTSFSSSYKWSIPDSTIVPYDNVYTTGAYTVKVYDIHGCQFMPLRSENIRVLKTPRVQIRGQLNYCANENISLNGYAGHGVSYMWYINNVAYAATPGINLYLDTGTYIFKLKLTVLDTLSGVYCDELDSVTVRVFPKPDVPIISGPLEVNCDLYHLQLIATATEPGTFNWSNSVAGPVNDIYDGGPFRVWFTNIAGCKSSADIDVPVNPLWYFQYLPSGCYDFCKQRIPITLYGPPNVSFHSWDWVHVGVSDTYGAGVMPPFDIVQSGSYQWILQTGDLCPQKSELLNVEIVSCDDCGKTSMDIKPECSGSPACYKLHITIADGLGGTFNIGTNNGPLDISSGTLSAGTPLSMTFVFTALDTDATGIVVYLEVTHPSGEKCMIALKVSLPDCSWIAEKPAGDTTIHLAHISTSMLVYPNPATQLVHISYNYGDGNYAERSLSVYDQLGRKVAEIHVPNNNGNWDVNTADLVPGMYIIRMEGDGKTLQTQRLIVNN